MENVYELVAHSAVLYCGIYNIYEKEKRILNKIVTVVNKVFPEMLADIKENCDKIEGIVVDTYLDTIRNNMMDILDYVENIRVIGEEVVEKVLFDISSVGLVQNDDIANFENYDEKQKKVVLNFLKATKKNSIKAFKTTYKNKEKYFHTAKENLKNIHDAAQALINTKKVDPFVVKILDKMKVDTNELTQDIIDMGRPKENLLKKIND